MPKHWSMASRGSGGSLLHEPLLGSTPACSPQRIVHSPGGIELFTTPERPALTSADARQATSTPAANHLIFVQGDLEGNTPQPESSEKVLSAGELQPLTLTNSKRDWGKRSDVHVRLSPCRRGSDTPCVFYEHFPLLPWFFLADAAALRRWIRSRQCVCGGMFAGPSFCSLSTQSRQSTSVARGLPSVSVVWHSIQQSRFAVVKEWDCNIRVNSHPCVVPLQLSSTWKTPVKNVPASPYLVDESPSERSTIPQLYTPENNALDLDFSIKWRGPNDQGMSPLPAVTPLVTGTESSKDEDIRGAPQPNEGGLFGANLSRRPSLRSHRTLDFSEAPG